VNSRVFDWAVGSQRLDIVEGSATSKTKEETTNNRLIAMDVGALTTLKTVALTNQ
jgi:hypothetical protein